MKNGRLENPTPAHSLLAMILANGGTARLNAGRLEIGPASLANKVRDRIIASKPEIIRLLLGISCPLCCFRLEMQGKSRLETQKTNLGAEKAVWITEQWCKNCGKRGSDHIQPDFPVFDKFGKEIGRLCTVSG